MKKVLVAIPHQQHSYQTFTAIGDNFEKVYMTTVYNSETLFDKLLVSILPPKFKSVYRNKKINQVPSEMVIRKNTLLGLAFLVAGHIFSNSFVYTLIMNILERAFGKNVVCYCKKHHVDILIMYDTAAEYAFKRLPDTIKILDMSSIPAPIIEDIIDLEQKTDDYLKDSLLDKRRYNHNFIERSYKEIKYANYYLCPSSFVEKSLIKLNVQPDNIFKVPYGVDTDFFKYQRRMVNHDTLKFVFVGRVEAAKGIYYLFEALRKANRNIELHMAGNVLVDSKYIPSNVVCHGFVDQNILLDILYGADVLIMTSLWEGLSLSVLEGMATGLPVICNENTGYKGIITNYENGIVLDELTINKVADALCWFDDNRELIPSMGIKASQLASCYTWTSYYENINQVMIDITSKETSEK